MSYIEYHQNYFIKELVLEKKKKLFFSDYGTSKENSDWADIEKVGTSNASNEEIKDIYFLGKIAKSG